MIQNPRGNDLYFTLLDSKDCQVFILFNATRCNPLS